MRIGDSSYNPDRNYTLQELIALRQTCQAGFNECIQKLEVLTLKRHLAAGEFSAAEDQALTMASHLDAIESAISEYQPRSAREYDLQASAVIDSIHQGLDKPSQTDFVKDIIQQIRGRPR